jgi:two-component system sensor histidine kinase YesM
MGVLLVDMDYSSVSRLLERINTSGKGLVHRSYGSHGKYTFFNTSCTESV